MSEQKPLVFLVDEHRKYLLTATQVLSPLVYDVHVASTIKTALELVDKQDRPATVFIDVNFTGAQEGIEVLRSMVKRSHHQITGVFFSNEMVSLEKAVGDGHCYGYYLKPTLTDDISGASVPNMKAYTDIFRGYVKSTPKRSKLYNRGARDGPTGLFNKNGLLDFVGLEFPRLARLQRECSVSVLFVDIDRLKAINENIGYSCGTQAILQVAKCLTQHGKTTKVRSYDIACRWGGDEFVILLLDISLAQAEAVKERLEKAADDLRVTAPGGKKSKFSISINLKQISHQKLKQLNTPQKIADFIDGVGDGVKAIKAAKRVESSDL